MLSDESDELFTSSEEVLPNSKGRAISNTNLRIGQPKGPMWPLLSYDMKRAFKIGLKISHMVTCLGYVLYSEEYRTSCVFMIVSICKE